MNVFPTRQHPFPLVALALAALVAGATPSLAADVTFRFRAPENANTVTVAGTFNDWNTTAAPMHDSDDDGVWEATIRIVEGTHQYKFVVNGTDWITDEFAAGFTDDGFGGQNSVLKVGAEALTAGDPDGLAVTATGTEVTFRFRPDAAHANSVSVAGTFNKWNAAAHPMADDDNDGVWEITLKLEPGDYAYQFVVNGDRWVGDKVATNHEDDAFGGRNALLSVGDKPIVVGPR